MIDQDELKDIGTLCVIAPRGLREVAVKLMQTAHGAEGVQWLNTRWAQIGGPTL